MTKTYSYGDIITDKKEAAHYAIDGFLQDLSVVNNDQTYCIDLDFGFMWYGVDDGEPAWHTSEHFGNGPWTVCVDPSKPVEPEKPKTFEEIRIAFNDGRKIKVKQFNGPYDIYKLDNTNVRFSVADLRFIEDAIRYGYTVTVEGE